MSHVATIDVEIKDLEALAEAASRLGLELVRGQQTYRCWYTSFPTPEEAEAERLRVGFTRESMMPAGFTFDQIGRCEHALRVIGAKNAYEVGLARRTDGRSGYTLLLDPIDYFEDGAALMDRIGPAGRKLKQEYAVAVARRQAQRQGFRLVEQRRADGVVQLTLSK